MKEQGTAENRDKMMKLCYNGFRGGTVGMLGTALDYEREGTLEETVLFLHRHTMFHEPGPPGL
jgi:hypothetical protein